MSAHSEDVLSSVLEQYRENGSGNLESLSGYLTCDGKVPLVDRALGMLGHGAPVLYNMMSAVMVDTLSALLPALVACRSPKLPAVHSLGSWRDYQSGSSSVHEMPPSERKVAASWTNTVVPSRMSQSKLQSLVQHCEMFCASERADESLVMTLVDCILKTAASVPRFRFEATTSLYLKNSHQSAVPPFTSFLDMVVSNKERIYDKLSPCARLYAWRLRFSLLDEDLIGLTKEASRRPLLSNLSRPFEAAHCRKFILGLALAPDILAEVRRRLHSWFLLSGAASIWNLRTELMGAVDDVVNQPSSWVTMDDAEAYVPLRFSLYSSYLGPWLRILRMPPTYLGLIQLVNMLKDVDPDVSGMNRLGGRFTAATNHDSLWSLQLDFLHWWKFALRILFSRCDRHLAQSDDVCDESARTWLQSREVAARYVYSVMNPTSKLLQQAGASELMKVADRWIQLWKQAPVMRFLDFEKSGVDSRKRGRPDNQKSEVGFKKMELSNGSAARPEGLERWFADFCQACNAMGNGGRRDMITSETNTTVADANAVPTTGPCRFSDYVFKILLSADPTVLQQDFGFVLLLFVAFGTGVEVDHNLCVQIEQHEGAWLDPDGTHLAASTRSRLCTREPQHRTEGFTEAWPSMFWHQAATADLHSWVKGVAAIFDIFDGQDSSEAESEAGVVGGKVAILVVELVHELSSRLIETAQVPTLQDLRSRFGLWAQRGRMRSHAMEICTQCLERLDRSLLRLQSP